MQGIRLQGPGCGRQHRGISKKTALQVFCQQGGSLPLESVDTLFKQDQAKAGGVLNDASLGELEKLRRIIVAMPVEYNCVRVELLAEMNEKYPAVFARMNAHLRRAGRRPLPCWTAAARRDWPGSVDRDVFKLMVVGSMEKFIHSPSRS
ncbi:MAG: hypothetical protein ACLU9S_08065 [Oscillospiraceae bacterium]